ncbi:hypothetical protein AMATHDRAFT_87233 [Amanita thiersii Skay4041]|uniref:C2H2-type domain-containing protein n=1 Tax=Amanita thiersii Skay4041 TaxID=703135 RepID=A0A2A9NIZ4_9AGAR|nr:hypothetical protein AMATHDRAFT_87233 [Amanita thiersii Skay4041]
MYNYLSQFVTTGPQPQWIFDNQYPIANEGNTQVFQYMNVFGSFPVVSPDHGSFNPFSPISAGPTTVSPVATFYGEGDTSLEFMFGGPLNETALYSGPTTPAQLSPQLDQSTLCRDVDPFSPWSSPFEGSSPVFEPVTYPNYSPPLSPPGEPAYTAPAGAYNEFPALFWSMSTPLQPAETIYSPAPMYSPAYQAASEVTHAHLTPPQQISLPICPPISTSLQAPAAKPKNKTVPPKGKRTRVKKPVCNLPCSPGFHPHAGVLEKDHTPKMIICEWENCGMLIDIKWRKCVVHHLRVVHGVSGETKDQELCKWKGCKEHRPIQAQSVYRHVATIHGGLKPTPCPLLCGKDFVRVDNISRHLLTCRKKRTQLAKTRSLTSPKKGQKKAKSTPRRSSRSRRYGPY